MFINKNIPGTLITCIRLDLTQKGFRHMTNLPKAFIFDLDGVITDTAEFHFLAWRKLAGELEISIDRQFNEQLKGIGRTESLEEILALNPSLSKISEDRKAELAVKKNEYYKQLIKSVRPDDILPGIIPLLRKIKEENIKIALGSASKNAFALLTQLKLTTYFNFVVDAREVVKGKPDPETFTTAAEALSVPYDNCIGIEDSVAGIEAINRANMFSVGVGEKEHLNEAAYVVENTNLLTFEETIKQYLEWKNKSVI